MIVDATELVLGRGEVYFERFADGATTGFGERYIGNTTQFTIERTIERVRRTHSYRGRKIEKRGAVTSMEIEVTFITDNISIDNIADWYGAETQSVSGGDEFFTITEQQVVRKGLFYQLGKNQTVVGFNYVDKVQVRKGSTILTQGVDYGFEQNRGRIQILNGSARVVDGDTLTFEYRKRPSGMTVTPSEAEEVYGALRYIAAEDQIGPRTSYYLPFVRLSPQGAIDLKGDEFQQMRFDAAAMKLNPATEMLYAVRRTGMPIPITADSTLITADSTLVTADAGAWQPSI